MENRPKQRENKQPWFSDALNHFTSCELLLKWLVNIPEQCASTGWLSHCPPLLILFQNVIQKVTIVSLKIIENHSFFPSRLTYQLKCTTNQLYPAAVELDFQCWNISTSPRQYLMRYLEVASTHQQLWSNLSGINDLSQLHEYTESFSLRFCLLHRKHYIAARPSVLS